MDPVQYCDHLVGEEGAGGFAFLFVWLVFVCLALFDHPLDVIGILFSVIMLFLDIYTVLLAL